MRNAAVNHFDGNAARKIQYDVYSENNVLKEKKKTRAHGKAAVKVIATVVIIFLMCFTIMYRYALATEMNYKINSLNQEYTKLKDTNSMLKVEIGEKTDLDQIREFASNELGMTAPIKTQIMHVCVPGEDITVVSEEYRDFDRAPAGKGPFTVITDRISRLSKLLY